MDLSSTDDGNGTLQEHLKKLPCLMQQLSGDRENLKTKNALLLQFVRGLSVDLNDCQSSQKKYKVGYFFIQYFLLFYVEFLIVIESTFKTTTIIIKSIRSSCPFL